MVSENKLKIFFEVMNEINQLAPRYMESEKLKKN